MVGPEPGRVATIGQRGDRAAGRGGLTVAEAQPVTFLDDLQEIHRRVGENPRRRRIDRAAIDLGRGAELGHPALPQRRGVATQQQRLFRFGRGIDEDGAGRLEDLRDLHPQLLAQLVVEIGERFVQQDKARVLDQRAGQRAALLLAARQFQRLAPKHRGQLHQLRAFADPAVNLPGVHPQKFQRRGDVVIDAHRRVVDELLVDHGDLAVLHPHPGHIRAVPEDLPRRRHIEPGHQAHERGLARKRRPKQHVHRAVLKHQVGRMDMRLPLDGLRYAFQFQRHLRLPLIPPRSRRTGIAPPSMCPASRPARASAAGPACCAARRHPRRCGQIPCPSAR